MNIKLNSAIIESLMEETEELKRKIEWLEKVNNFNPSSAYIATTESTSIKLTDIPMKIEIPIASKIEISYRKKFGDFLIKAEAFNLFDDDHYCAAIYMDDMSYDPFRAFETLKMAQDEIYKQFSNDFLKRKTEELQTMKKNEEKKRAKIKAKKERTKNKEMKKNEEKE